MVGKLKSFYEQLFMEHDSPPFIGIGLPEVIREEVDQTQIANIDLLTRKEGSI